MKYEFCRPDRFCKVVYIAEDQFGGNRSQAHQPSQSCHNPGLECFELERVVGTGGGVFFYSRLKVQLARTKKQSRWTSKVGKCIIFAAGHLAKKSPLPCPAPCNATSLDNVVACARQCCRRSQTAKGFAVLKAVSQSVRLLCSQRHLLVCCLRIQLRLELKGLLV